jgi:hypothetical protein
MDLPKGCIHFNAEIEKVGGTPSWGQELGQVQPEYLISREGASEIINGMLYNMVEINHAFDYGPGGGNFTKEILAVFKKVIIKVYDAESKSISQFTSQSPLILLIGKETTASHSGRRVLKLNQKFKYAQYSNTEFYSEVNRTIGGRNPWFSKSIDYEACKDGDLVLTIIKAPIPENKYPSAEIRSEIWEQFCKEYDSLYSSQIKKSYASKTTDFVKTKLRVKDFVRNFNNFSSKKGYEFN